MQDGSRAAAPLLEARRGWITRHTPLYHVQEPYKQKRKTSAQPAQQRLKVMPAVSPLFQPWAPHTKSQTLEETRK